MFSLAPAQRGVGEGLQGRGWQHEGGEPREWVARGPHRLAGTRDRGTNRCRESQSPRRTASGPRPGTCARPGTPAAPPPPPGRKGRSRRRRPARTGLADSQPGSRSLRWGNQSLLSGGFCSTRKKQSLRPLPWLVPLSRMFLPQRLLWSSPSLLSF